MALADITQVDIEVDEIYFEVFEKEQLAAEWYELGDISLADLPIEKDEVISLMKLHEIEADVGIVNATQFLANSYGLTMPQVTLALKLASKFVKGEL